MQCEQVFGAGAKGDPESYEGGRTSSDIVQFATDKANENKAPPEVKEITSAEGFKGCSDAQVLSSCQFSNKLLVTSIPW